MLQKVLERQGANHRRWRILLAMLLAPFAVYAFSSSGWMSTRLGPLVEQRWDFFCLFLAFAGLAIRVHLAGYAQSAEPGQLLPQGSLRTEGFYSLVRHPSVLANFLILLSVTLLFKSLFFTVLAMIVACLYFERLMLAKERALLERYGEQFTAWAAATPLIVPRISGWKKLSEPFSIAKAVRREAGTLAFIGTIFFGLETLEGVLIDGLPLVEWIQREPHWLGLFAVSAIVFGAQLSKMWAVAVLLIASATAGLLYTVLSMPSRANESERSFKALREGGYVLLMRHADTEGEDFDQVDVNNCDTQRNLSNRGGEYARALGQMLREQGVDFTRVVTSEYCRTRETALLMGLRSVETMNHLNERRLKVTLIERLFGSSSEDESLLRPVRAMIADWKEPGTLLVVSHAPIISGLAFTGLQTGEGLVLKPAAELPTGFRVVGKISPPGLRR